MGKVGSWKANGEVGPKSVVSASVGGRVICGGERRARLFGGCEVSASEGRGASAFVKRPSRFPSGRPVAWSILSSSVSSSRSRCSIMPCSDLVGELAVEIDMALLVSDIDSSLILVLSGRRTCCWGTVFAILMLPVDFEYGESSIGVDALSLVIDDGESKEND